MLSNITIDIARNQPTKLTKAIIDLDFCKLIWELDQERTPTNKLLNLENWKSRVITDLVEIYGDSHHYGMLSCEELYKLISR